MFRLVSADQKQPMFHTTSRLTLDGVPVRSSNAPGSRISPRRSGYCIGPSTPAWVSASDLPTAKRPGVSPLGSK